MRKAIFVLAVLALGGAAMAGNILPGFDHLKAQPGSEWDFSTNPIPADFFGPGSEPFQEVSGHITVTKVWREKPAEFLDPTVPVTVETEIVAMSLHSVAPIRVTYDGGAFDSFFDVFITLDPAGGVSTGEYILAHNAGGLPDGGLMQIDSFFDVFFDIQFTPVDGGAPLHLFRRQRLTLVDPVPWSHTAPPLYDFGDSGGFFPGVDPFAETLPDDLYVPQTLVFQGSEFRWAVRLNAVPEPATLALLALGVATLRRRRR